MCHIFAHRLFLHSFYRQNVLEMVHREKSPDGTYSTYFPFGDMRDVPYMTHFHDKTTEGSRKYTPPTDAVHHHCAREYSLRERASGSP